MLCPPTNAVKTPLLGCLPNTEIILITPYGLFFVSSRHNYGKFRIHGLQPSCQDTMPSGSLTCEIPIFEVQKKNIEWSQNQAPHLNFFIDHLKKLRSFIFLWIHLLATERQTIMRQVDLILGHKKSYPFCVFLRPLDGATRLRFQGDNTSCEWRNFIANCRNFNYK